MKVFKTVTEAREQTEHLPTTLKVDLYSKHITRYKNTIYVIDEHNLLN
jgi:hypothetical protein